MINTSQYYIKKTKHTQKNHLEKNLLLLFIT